MILNTIKAVLAGSILTVALTLAPVGNNSYAQTKVEPQAIEDIKLLSKLSNYNYKVYKQGLDFHVYFTSSIKSKEAYIPLVHKMLELDSDNRIFLHLDNPGGSVFTGLYIIDALKRTKAESIAVVTSGAFSMAALLSCSTDKLVINDHAFLMFHTWSVGGLGGKGSEILEIVKAIDHTIRASLEGQCARLLSTAEIEKIMNGTDVYLYGTRINKVQQ